MSDQKKGGLTVAILLAAKKILEEENVPDGDVYISNHNGNFRIFLQNGEVREPFECDIKNEGCS